MPVIAVGAAIAATAFAAADVVAVGLTIATALEVTAAVGATLAAVGTITKDKTLTMVGGAIGLVGAIGGLASAAGVFGSAADAPIFGAAPAASTSSAAADTGATFADSLTPATMGTGGGVEAGAWDAGMSAANAGSSGTIQFVAGLPPGETEAGTFSQVAERVSDPAANLANTTTPAVANVGGTVAPPTGTIDPATGLPATNTTGNGLINQPGSSADLIEPPPAPPNNLGATDPTTGETITRAIDPSTGKIVSLPDKPSTFGSILKFANDNKTLVSGVMTVGGKMLEGAFSSSVAPAQVEALQAQAAANNAAAALANQQRANLAMPKAVASSQPITGTPGPIIPPRAGNGLINQPQLAPVTGTV